MALGAGDVHGPGWLARAMLRATFHSQAMATLVILMVTVPVPVKRLMADHCSLGLWPQGH